MTSEFQAVDPYVSEYPTALAMSCSDGRFTNAVEELLRHLGHARLDTLTVPGGPALLDVSAASLNAQETAKEAISFLIRSHAIRHVVLLAHEGCGYYRTRSPYDSGESIMRRQLADLRNAARWVRGEHSDVNVIAYCARVVGRRVAFATVDS